MVTVLKSLCWLVLAGIMVSAWSSYAQNDSPVPADFVPDPEEDEPAPSKDFEQRAAQLHQWLQQRQEERQRMGEAFVMRPEKSLNARPKQLQQRTRPAAAGNAPRLPNRDGRQHHVIDPNQPIFPGKPRSTPKLKKAP